MKRIFYGCLLAGLLLLAAAGAEAQVTAKQLAKHRKEVAWSRRSGKALVSLDTIYLAGEPYGLLKSPAKISSEHQVFSLTGEPLLWVAQEHWEGYGDYRIYTFQLNGDVRQAAIPLLLNFSKNDIGTEIFKYGLIDKNGLNLPQVQAFLRKYEISAPAAETGYGSSSESQSSSGSNSANASVSTQPIRDRRAKVYRSGRKEIRQDNATIAWVRETTDKTDKSLHVAQLYSADLLQLTEISWHPAQANKVIFRTITDGKTHQLELRPEQEPLLEVAAYLVAKGYL